MINSIGLSTGGSLGVSGQTSTQRSDAASAVARTPTASLEDKGAVSTTVSQIAALGAPVDTDRVASLKAAIRSGAYRLDPDAIAQKMISTDMGVFGGTSL